MRLDALRRASAASASPAKHFAYSSKTEAFASPPSLKGALGAPRGEFFKTLIVREALCELELPYILQNVGDGSLRLKLLEASGSKEVPYLIDPNTGTHVGDYKKILSYLFQTYSAATLV